ncbi:phage recombination protein Bet [Streptomyces iakyrus]|uniref:phage recombination protein Bet n=1 Tax=Streptomyces iakyrus TaxID=68219 RepID=UPI00068B4CD3|nr:phage recombination protein Bet [Streptomyces iakyrus]
MNDIVKAGGSLAIRPDQTDWTPQQGAVLRQSGIDNEVTAEELSAFLHLCQRTRLDPFSRQIYLIGRWDNRQRRKVYTPQTSIDGYRVIGHRVVAEQGGDLGYEDTLWCDANGQWRDVWLLDEPPAAAKVTVIRNGQRFPAVALFREYVQTNKDDKPIGLWGKMPAGQLAKCAEALALRKAFPHDLAGVYTAEEMAQADNPAPEERHLRKVQPGEGDPWATPGPDAGQAGTTAVKGRSQPAQAIADVAGTTTDQAAVKELYRQAHGEGLLAETVKTADRELLELGAYLIARGQQLAQPKPTTGEGKPGEDVPDAVVVAEGEAEADVAERELRAAATAAGLDNLDEEFEQSYGIPIAQAGAQQMRQMTAILTGSAA